MPAKSFLLLKLVIPVVILVVILYLCRVFISIDIDDSIMYEKPVSVAGNSKTVLSGPEKVPVYYRPKGMFGWLTGLVQMPESFPGGVGNEIATTSTDGRYYLAIPGYHLSPSFTVVKEERSYFLYRLADSIKHEGSKQQLTPLLIRYLPDQSEKGIVSSTNIGAVLVPLSTAKYRNLQYLFWALMLIILVGAFYVLCILPFPIVKNIVKRQPFTPRTVRSLFIIGWSLVGFVGLILLIALIAQLVFSNEIPAAFSYSFSDFLMESCVVWIAGLTILVLAVAFRKGLEIKTERDLHI